MERYPVQSEVEKPKIDLEGMSCNFLTLDGSTNFYYCIIVYTKNMTVYFSEMKLFFSKPNSTN